MAKIKKIHKMSGTQERPAPECGTDNSCAWHSTSEWERVTCNRCLKCLEKFKKKKSKDNRYIKKHGGSGYL